MHNRIRKGFVYLLSGDGIAKIGVSRNVEQRREALQVETGIELKTEYSAEFKTFKTALLVEMTVHRKLAGGNAHICREWYEPEIEYLISEIKKAEKVSGDERSIDYLLSMNYLISSHIENRVIDVARLTAFDISKAEVYVSMEMAKILPQKIKRKAAAICLGGSSPVFVTEYETASIMNSADIASKRVARSHRK